MSGDRYDTINNVGCSLRDSNLSDEELERLEALISKVIDVMENPKIDFSLTEYHTKIRGKEKKFWCWFKGKLRDIWSLYPIKQYYFENSPVEKDAYTLEDYWQCSKCESVVPRHMAFAWNESHYPTDFTDFVGMLEFMIDQFNISVDDLSIVCKECKEIEHYSYRYGVSPVDALIRRSVRDFLNDSPKSQKYYLMEKGYSLEDVSHAKKRKALYTDIMREHYYGERND